MMSETEKSCLIKLIRKAEDSDRHNVALCIAEAFEKDFSLLSTDTNKITAAIAPGLQMDKFYVAEVENDIVGVMAISDCRGRAARVDKTAMRKTLGFIKGIIGNFALKKEFEKQLEYPVTTGYIEFVAVRKKHRKKGVAACMLKESIKLSEYRDFVLDVTDINTNAIRCYFNLGFKELKRIPEKHAKFKGFKERIYMGCAKSEIVI